VGCRLPWQQWVGDHPEEWFHSRVQPSTAVVAEIEAAGVLVFAGGLVEDMSRAFSADGTGGSATTVAGAASHPVQGMTGPGAPRMLSSMPVTWAEAADG
jgi:hypothetical protein